MGTKIHSSLNNSDRPMMNIKDSAVGMNDTKYEEEVINSLNNRNE